MTYRSNEKSSTAAKKSEKMEGSKRNWRTLPRVGGTSYRTGESKTDM
jgi:hypothetical protein